MNPEEFKRRIIEKYPNGVTNAGVRYADMPALELTQKMVEKYPNGVTSDSIPYKNFLPQTPTQVTQASSSRIPLWRVSEDELQKPSILKSAVRPVVNLPLSLARGIEDVTRIPSEVEALYKESGGILPTIANLAKGTAETVIKKPIVGAATALQHLVESPVETLGRGAENVYRISQEQPMIIPLALQGMKPKAVETLAKPVMVPIRGGIGKLSQRVQEASIRITPATRRIMGEEKIKAATDFLTKNNVIGKPEARLKIMDSYIDGLEETFQGMLNSPYVQAKFVPKNELIGKVLRIRDRYKNTRDITAVSKQLSEAVTTIKNMWGDKIPVNELNTLKRTTYKNAYNRIGTKVLDVIEHDIGDVAYGMLQSALKDVRVVGKTIKDFNKEYQSAINARKLVFDSIGKPQLGILGRISASILGAATVRTLGGGPISQALGFLTGQRVAETIAGTTARSALASIFGKFRAKK